MWGQILPPHQAYYLCLLSIFAGLGIILFTLFVQYVARHNNAHISNKGHNAGAEGIADQIYKVVQAVDYTIALIRAVYLVS